MKKWYESKTVWFNIVMTVLDIVSLAEFGIYLDPKIVTGIHGVGNIVLRVWFTDTVVAKKVL